MPAFLNALRFVDVDPRARVLDDAAVRAIVARVTEVAVAGSLESKTFAPGWHHDALGTAIEQALAEALGPWCTAFTWTASEMGDGGPLRSYCCHMHSLLAEDDVSALASVERVVTSVREWHDYLIALTKHFEEIHRRSSAFSLSRHVEHAAASLLPLVIEATQATDAWYSTFATILTWYLEFAGTPRALVETAVRKVSSGLFQSWCEPSAELQTTASKAFGERVEKEVQKSAPSAGDQHRAVQVWRETRKNAWTSPIEPKLVPIVWDQKRDPERARRLLLALSQCRQDAASGKELSFSLLSSWQSLVLGEPAPFRTTDAFAKAGTERYAYSASAETMYSAWLTEANDLKTPLHVRAARVYLDTCFMHPFIDGNARAARLVIDFVLAREKQQLRYVHPVFMLSRAPDDWRGADHLAWVLGQLAGAVL
jgi:Fic/DOC family